MTMYSNITFRGAETLNDELRSVLLPVTIYVGAEAVLGFLGNIIVLFVFTFHYQLCNFRYFVLCLALTDVIACCTAVSGEVVTQTYWYIYPVPEICKAKSFFNVFTVFAEAFCLLTIAVDRYRKVCTPLGWQITPRVAIAICVAIYILSGIIAIPVAVFWGTHDRTFNRTNVYLNGEFYKGTISVNVTVCQIDQTFLGQKQPEIYTNCLETIVSLSLVPMLVLYIFIARSLLGGNAGKYKRSRSEIQSDSDRKTDDVSKTGESHLAYNINIIENQSFEFKHELNDLESTTTSRESAPNTKDKNTSSETTSKKRERLNKKITIKKSKLRTRAHRKTRIMFILTFVFILTTITYLVMLELIADDILETLSDSGKAGYSFGFRFYFINHVINPVVYGFLDPQFRKAVNNIYLNVKGSCSRCTFRRLRCINI